MPGWTTVHSYHRCRQLGADPFAYLREALERLASLLLCQFWAAKLAQLVVDQRQELLGRLGLALLDGREDAGHVVHHRGHSEGSPGRADTKLRRSDRSSVGLVGSKYLKYYPLCM